jgi:predicted nucleotidyltransferase
VLCDDYSPNSDIDFFRMETELTQLFGRKVDLQTSQFIGPEILSSVLLEAVIAYKQA